MDYADNYESMNKVRMNDTGLKIIIGKSVRAMNKRRTNKERVNDRVA